MHLVEIALLLMALAGHMVLCVTLGNRIHSLSIPRWSQTALSAVCWSTLLVAPIALFPSIDAHGREGAITAIDKGRLAPLVYLIPAWLLFAWGVAAFLTRRFKKSLHRVALISERIRTIDLGESLGKRLARGRTTSAFARLPGNELLHLHIHEKTVQLPRLPPAMSGLSIAHLSDLHMSGKVDSPYFEEIVDRTNELSADMVMITGDLFDSNECLAWIPATFARLKARGGVYFILGNHDLRIDFNRARRELVDAGLIDLGSRRLDMSWNGQPLVLAGNELPWFVPAADMTGCPEESASGRPLRILLSHTPDQIDWARRFDFDLMLAGHTHGGQVRLPIIGPVLSPSRMGTRFASGTFYLDPTVMHVSRGISSLTPLRWNCAPELAMLILQSASEVDPALCAVQGAGA